MLEVFSKGFDYQWRARYTGNIMFLSKDGVNPLKYQVPTDLGVLALCAHYKIKKGFDIGFCPTIEDLPEVLEKIYQDVKGHDGECKKALIYSIGQNIQFDRHNKKPTHVVPILFCKYRHPQKDSYKIAIFFMDSVSDQQMDRVNGTNEITNFMYHKRFSDNEKDDLLPLFKLSLSTQVDGFSCRIKAIVDMRRALSMKGDDDYFRGQIYENWSSESPIFIDKLSLALHKTTQNKKALGDNADKERESLDFFKVTGKKVDKVKVPKYLFHKTKSYLADLERDLRRNSEEFLSNMLEQSYPKGKYDAEIKGCMDRTLCIKESPSSSPKVAGVVKSVIEVLRGNIDGGRL